MTELLYQWADLLWILIAWFVVHKHQRVKMIAYILSCVLTLRLQVEMMLWMEKPYGLLPIMESHVYPRGLVVYSVFTALFILLAMYSKRTRPAVMLAASITVYFAAFTVSSVLMIL